MGLVDHQHTRVPQRFRGVHQCLEEQPHESHALSVLELVEIDNRRCVELQDLAGDAAGNLWIQVDDAFLGRQDIVAFFTQGGTVAFDIQDDLLDLAV